MIPIPTCATTPFPSADKGVIYEQLPREEQIRLCDAMHAGDRDARDALILSVLPWLYAICQAVTRKTTTADEFQQVVLEAMESLKDFDARKGAITTWITRRPPWVISRMRRRTASILSRPQNPPTKYSAADELAAQCIYWSTLDFDQEQEATPHCEPPDYEGTEDLIRLRREIDYLPEQLKSVLRERLAGQELKAIARKIGVSKERVRQIESLAILSLRRRMLREDVDALPAAA